MVHDLKRKQKCQIAHAKKENAIDYSFEKRRRMSHASVRALEWESRPRSIAFIKGTLDIMVHDLKRKQKCQIAHAKKENAIDSSFEKTETHEPCVCTGTGVGASPLAAKKIGTIK